MTQNISYMNKIKTILPQMVEWFNLFSTIYLIATFITSFDYQRPAIYAYFISTFLDIIINQRYLNNKWHKAKITFIVMIIFYGCIWIWHAFEQCNSNEFFHSTDTRLPFLAFGTIGLLCNINPKIKIKYITYTMLITSIASITYIALKKYDILFAPTTTLETFRTLLPLIRHELLHVTHIEYNLYLNCTMTMCFIYCLDNNKKLEKIIFIIGITIIYLTLLLNEGRTGLLTATILFFIFSFITIYYYRPKLLLPTIIVVTTITTLFINGHDRFNFDNIEKDPRNVIWKTSTEIIKEKPILGYGVCRGREIFIERTANNPELNNFWTMWYTFCPTYNKNRFHCHNAFLESTIEFGLLGLILSISIFLLPILLTKNKRQLYLSFFILIFIIQAMFESFTFHYQIILFCWLLNFFINTKLSDKKLRHLM